MTRSVTVLDSFRAAVEAHDLPAILATLDQDIKFRSPVVVKPYHGKEQVAAFLRILLGVFEDFHYTGEMVGPARYGSADAAGGPRTQALIFSTRVMDKEIQGLDLITYNEAGLVTDLTVMVRPLSGAVTLARVVARHMSEAAISA